MDISNVIVRHCDTRRTRVCSSLEQQMEQWIGEGRGRCPGTAGGRAGSGGGQSRSRAEVKDTESRFPITNEANAALLCLSSDHAAVGRKDGAFCPAEGAARFRADEVRVIETAA